MFLGTKDEKFARTRVVNSVHLTNNFFTLGGEPLLRACSTTQKWETIMSIRLTRRVSWSVLANLLSIYPLSLGTVCTPPAMSCNVKTNNSNHHLHPPLLQELWFLIRKFPFLSAVRTTWKAKRFNRFFKVPFWQMEVLGGRRPRMMSNFLAVTNKFLLKCFKSDLLLENIQF